jgi:hypothetical protein
MSALFTVVIESKYRREQFEDWLAGGTVEYNGQTFYWEARDGCAGFGWDIAPINQKNWDAISEEEYDGIMEVIEKALNAHETHHVF